MSSATQKANPRKIKSALSSLNPQSAALIVALLVLLLAGGVRLVPRRYTLVLDKQSYHLEVARTEAQQEKGLGGRSGLAANAGMLFVFEDQTDHCFWMKGMHFPIDIVWADITKHVTGIESNLSPSTYPKNYCNIAQYVIELPAGTAAAHKLHINEPIHF